MWILKAKCGQYVTTGGKLTSKKDFAIRFATIKNAREFRRKIESEYLTPLYIYRLA